MVLFDHGDLVSPKAYKVEKLLADGTWTRTHPTWVERGDVIRVYLPDGVTPGLRALGRGFFNGKWNTWGVVVEELAAPL